MIQWDFLRLHSRLEEIDKQFALLDEDGSGSLDWNDIRKKRERERESEAC